MNSKSVAPRALLHEVFADGLSSQEEAMLVDAFAMSPSLSPMLTPSPRLKLRLLEAIERPRYAFLDRVARLLDVARDQARSVLDLVDDAARWESGGPGCWLIHLTGGPSLNDAVVGLVKVEAGVRFPRHVHVGDESVLVLQGGIRDDAGRISLPGDLVTMPASTEHEFEALPGEDLLYLAVVQEGVDFAPAGGGLILPPSRRD